MVGQQAVRRRLRLVALAMAPALGLIFTPFATRAKAAVACDLVKADLIAVVGASLIGRTALQRPVFGVSGAEIVLFCDEQIAIEAMIKTGFPDRAFFLNAARAASLFLPQPQQRLTDAAFECQKAAIRKGPGRAFADIEVNGGSIHCISDRGEPGSTSLRFSTEPY